jgi:CheY-like chemotaxis protein
MTIWPDAISAQNNMAAVSAQGSTVCVLILRLNSPRQDERFRAPLSCRCREVSTNCATFYSVVEAGSRAQSTRPCSTLARSFRPEIVLCDIGLPDGMDGNDVARAVRRDSELAAARLVAVTGYGHAEAVEAGCSAGFELHLTKPIDRDALEKMLATLPHLAGP